MATRGDIYSGSNIVQERATTSHNAIPGFSTSADNTIGEITKVFLTEGGIGYQSLQNYQLHLQVQVVRLLFLVMRLEKLLKYQR